MKIKLTGVKNIRDFSELGLKGYIRSAHLNALSTSDMQMLKNKMDLKTIIDLRTTEETNDKPDREIEGVNYIHIPIFDHSIPGISHEKDTSDNNDFINMMPDMEKMYYLLVTDEEYLAQIKKVMAVISDPERKGAVLWHCTEGKDRCGIISAIFLLSKGIDRNTVLEDYLKTNKVNYFKAWKYFFLVFLLKKDVSSALKVKNVFLAKKEYIEPIMDILADLAKEFR